MKEGGRSLAQSGLKVTSVKQPPHPTLGGSSPQDPAEDTTCQDWLPPSAPPWQVIHSFVNADPQQGERSRVPLKVKNKSAPRIESPSAASLRQQPPHEGP